MSDNNTPVFTDEHKQKEDLAKIELEQVLQEKDQLSKDLNELERSFSSVVKRLDRCKEVIEGFKKVCFLDFWIKTSSQIKMLF